MGELPRKTTKVVEMATKLRDLEAELASLTARQVELEKALETVLALTSSHDGKTLLVGNLQAREYLERALVAFTAKHGEPK